ncbi:MAG: hypothetical protein H0W50_06425 [Parachlamydiaceae bacterium]|nr:hypothetical protein [Parachlamydiaceae bacterium]
MEPIRGGMQTIIGSIIPVENIPLQELPEYYTALAVKAKDIYNLWEQALQNSAVVENAFEENVQGDENFAETFEGALNVAAREIEFLNGENTHLKNQKIEITKAAYENAKSAWNHIIELKEVVVSQNSEIERLRKIIAIQEKAIVTVETVLQGIPTSPVPLFLSSCFYRCCDYYNPRLEILKNVVKETRKQELEFFKG